MADGTGGEHVAQLLKFYAVAGTATLTSTAGSLLATSDGDGGIEITDENIFWAEQGLVDRKGQIVRRDVMAVLNGLTTKVANLETLFGISSSATASMRDGSGTATGTARRITDTTENQYFRLMVVYTDSDSDQTVKWYCPRCLLAEGITLPITPRTWMQHDLRVKLLAPADGGGTVLEQLNG